MIRVDRVKVYNIANAIYSARNPMNSWDRSDSDLDRDIVGENDLKLAKKLYTAGPEHRKYLRQILVSLDITAPFYWWKEMDTYRIGVTANSCSTMHKLMSKPFELDDFSFDQLTKDSLENYGTLIVTVLNSLRDKYQKETDDVKKKKIWYDIIQLLPSSYNQKRTITMNYENVISMIHQRQGHKLYEWNDFVMFLKELPYIKDITE